MEVSIRLDFFSRHRIASLLLIFVALIGIAAAIILTSPMSANVGPDWTQINCDVKLLRFNTNVNVYKNNDQIGVVKGNIIRFLTDPLTYYDTSGNKLAYAGDTYHLIAQDSHSIVVDGVVTCEMVGKIKLIGEAYDIYDTSGHLMATAEFDFLNLNGKITNVNGTPIVVYRATPVLKDYTIYISPDCILDESTVVMICSSYYSDHAADSSDSSSSSD